MKSEQKAGTYKTKSWRSGLLLMAGNPHSSSEKTSTTFLGLNPTAKTKDFPMMPVGLPWEKCLPGINWVISITLKCQARLGEEPLRHLGAPPTQAWPLREGGKWKIQLHSFGVGHDPP